MRRKKLLLSSLNLLCILLIFVSFNVGTLWAATINAASCSSADVGTAVARASDGDTVNIPAGSCTWTTNLTITNKILTIQGAGIGQTIITDQVDKSAAVPWAFRWITKDGGLTRMTGITWQGGTLLDMAGGQGSVYFIGTSHQFRIDHCRFTTTHTRALVIAGFMWGVVDHNTFDLNGNNPAIEGLHNTWNGVPYGDGSWADPSFLGTEKAIFMEDNTFNYTPLSSWTVMHDGYGGEHIVYRFNTSHNLVFANHGTESNGRTRGGRTFEVYNNTMTLDNQVQGLYGVGMRSGVGVVFNNTLTGPWNGMATLKNFRSDDPYAPWGKCDGTSMWDQNKVGQGGYACLDQHGYGQSNLLSGDTPINTVTGIVTWPHQVADPSYCWNNTLNGSATGMVTQSPGWINENRDFFNSAKPGYTPYVYPHPLVTGSPAPPNPPANLRVQ